ncbi:hypothetical protein, partial [Burkholderia sp. Ac-20365]|uniref:hypothetical protein n=1 Tax=Burkholderia sp. Ac-20365 TaxID=2703897 RepID=UPI00197B5ADF
VKKNDDIVNYLADLGSTPDAAGHYQIPLAAHYCVGFVGFAPIHCHVSSIVCVPRSPCSSWSPDSLIGRASFLLVI